MVKTVSFLVRGGVQGVGFRYTTRQAAEFLGLVGWVRNRSNGDVEGVVQGDTDSIAKFENWLWQGPDYARVTSVITDDVPPIPDLDFVIRR